MEFLEKLRDQIRHFETADLYKAFGIFFALFFFFFGALFYLHYRKVTRYTSELKKMVSLRTQTKRIVSDYKIVKAQKEKVEEILAQDKTFRIGETYQSIVQKVGIFPKLQEPITPVTGETISGKTEVQVSSRFSGINMKQVVDLLSQIAQVPRLYTKDLTIKKTPNTLAVDIDITVATLEPSEP